MTRPSQLAKIRAHCARAPATVLLDEAGGQLMDVASGKLLALCAGELERVEERADAQTKRPYLVLAYGDGRQVALSDAGIAFAPDFRNTGQLADLPEVVCFRDFAALVARLKHELYGHADREPTRDTVKLLMMCIAIVDGARAQGFEVGREEKELEWHLAELEKRAP